MSSVFFILAQFEPYGYFILPNVGDRRALYVAYCTKARMQT